MFLVQLPSDTFHMMRLKLLISFSGCNFHIYLLVDLVLLWVIFFLLIYKIDNRRLETLGQASLALWLIGVYKNTGTQV